VTCVTCHEEYLYGPQPQPFSSTGVVLDGSNGPQRRTRSPSTRGRRRACPGLAGDGKGKLDLVGEEVLEISVVE